MVKKKPVKKQKTQKTQKKQPKKQVKAVSKAVKAKTPANVELVLPKKLSVKPQETLIVYGMEIDPKRVQYAAVEAYNKKRYVAEDIKLQEYCINNPKFHNLMVKIAVLDRIQEEMLRLYPAANVKRQNSITLTVE